MNLTEADARVFLTEGLLSADIEDHEEAIENYDKALEIVQSVETVSYTHLTLPTNREV